ncbi:MAG TPA: lipoprotein [Alphaproteobacteria bacterium]|nr:lipoprotein [Alphaproteobacteria bacterium]
MKRVIAIFLLTMMAATTLAACGKKGPLELPNGRTANPGQQKKGENQSGF